MRLFTEEELRGMLADAIEQAWNADADTTVGQITERVLADHPTTFPPDEPVFVLRASDTYAETALHEYTVQGDRECHDEAARTVAQFLAFARDHPERMRAPD
jgi:hypothetical protein